MGMREIKPAIIKGYNDEPDFSVENDVLEFADEIINYILNELRENLGEDWNLKFQALTPEGQKMLFRALADGFNDSVDN